LGDKLLDSHILSQDGVSSVSPGFLVYSQTILPFVIQYVSWVVSIVTCVVPAVLTSASFTPSVVDNYSVLYRALVIQPG